MTKLTLLIIPILVLTCYKPYEIKIGKVEIFHFRLSDFSIVPLIIFFHIILGNIKAFNYTSLSFFPPSWLFHHVLNFVIGVTYLALQTNRVFQYFH